jgi:dTDP-glucose 4,6-dehydratase
LAEEQQLCLAPRASGRVRVLVAGGAGFLGSHLCDRLLREGHDVTAADNLLTGAARNLEDAQRSPRFEFLQHDLTQGAWVHGELDRVYHLASPASPPDYLRHPLETLRVGSAGTEHLLQLAHAKRARVLVASTSEVYGDPEVSPQPESYWGRVNPVGPRSVYDEAKRYMEALTMAWHRAKGLETRIARIFNTYGPRMRLDDGRVVPSFIGQLLRGEPLTVHGSGQQTRSFCHVDDLVEGLLLLMERGDSAPCNLGNPHEVTVLELGQRLARIAGCELRTVHTDPMPDDPRRRCPDIARAKSLLGWEPRVPLDEGLQRTWAWFRGRAV